VHGAPKRRRIVGVKMTLCCLCITPRGPIIYNMYRSDCCIRNSNHQETKHIQEALPDCLLELPVYVCFLDYRHIGQYSYPVGNCIRTIKNTPLLHNTAGNLTFTL